MKRLVLIALLAAAPLGASAQQPAFEPYTVTAQDQTALFNMLGEVPAKYANPIITHLLQLEQRAVVAKAVEAAKAKPKEPAKDEKKTQPKKD